MNVVAPPNPSAWPPIQIRTTKKSGPQERDDAVVEGGRAGGASRADFTSEAAILVRQPVPAGPKKFTEPVALSSTFPVNLRLPPTALGSGFDLLALRARCKRELRGPAGAAQGRQDRVSRNLRKEQYARADSPFVLLALERNPPVRDQKFAEPVAVSSIAPGDVPLPRTTAGFDFDLLALRARRREKPTGRRAGRQVQE